MSGHLLASQHIESDSCPRFLPMMITRLLLSLEKAGASQEHGRNFGEPTTYTIMNFAEYRRGVTMRDETPLHTLSSTREGGQ